MGYLYLFLALIAGATKGHCGKKTSGIVHSIPNITLMHCLRMFFCIIIGFALVLIFDKGFGGFILDWKSALICLFSAFTTSFFIITWVICVRKTAYAMLNVFLVLSTLIPIIICNIAWGEAVSALKIVGYIVLVGAVILMCKYNNKVKTKLRIKDVVLLTICGIFNGLSSFTQKWRVYEVKDIISVYSFNFYTYLFAFFILLILYLCTRKPLGTEEKFNVKSVFWYVVILSVCLFLNSLFYSMAAETLPSAILYPLSNGFALVIATLLGHFLYKEKLNTYAYFGIGLALISFVLMVLSTQNCVDFVGLIIQALNS